MRLSVLPVLAAAAALAGLGAALTGQEVAVVVAALGLLMLTAWRPVTAT